MAETIIRIKTRDAGGSVGAPASLMSGEIAYNMADGIFYVGFGDNGAGVATSIKAFASHDFDPDSAGSYTEGTGITITGDEIAVDLAVIAVLASPAFTGNPTAPTQAGGNNSTRIATTAFVTAAINALVASAPGALDTLNELAAALGNDASFAATVTTALAGKQALDATLTALAGLTVAANKGVYATGADAFATFDLTAFGRSFSGAADAAAARTLLGLDEVNGGTF